MSSSGELVAAIVVDHGSEPRACDAVREVRVLGPDEREVPGLQFMSRHAGEHETFAKPASGTLLFVYRRRGVSDSGEPMP